MTGLGAAPDRGRPSGYQVVCKRGTGPQDRKRIQIHIRGEALSCMKCIPCASGGPLGLSSGRRRCGMPFQSLDGLISAFFHRLQDIGVVYYGGGQGARVGNAGSADAEGTSIDSRASIRPIRARAH